MTTVIWTQSALADLQNIRRYIGEFNPYAARDMAIKIMEVGNSLLSFPYRGRAVPNSNLREMPLPHPYVMRYRIDQDRVIILRVRHAARRPN